MSDDTFSTRLERIRDELKVRAHLAALEARDAWDRAHLARVGDELAAARDEARLQTHLGAMDARDAWGRLEEEARTLAGKAGADIDQAISVLVGALEEIIDRAAQRAIASDEQKSVR
ncbi:MAG: hypothetical protein M3Y87_04205 [Myxococcota bacterium]|nr:hypothetical protein [Myxococcota bacterium]